MNAIRKGIILSSFSQYYTIILGILRLVILSRIFTSEEFGIFMIAMSLMNLSRIFRNFGVWDYIISTKDISDEKLNNCFSIVLFISIFFCIIYISLAGFIGSIYNSEQLVNVVYIVTISFLLNPFGVVSQALMYRDMQFGRLFAIQFATTTINFGLSIVLAIYGFGVMSLAWGFVAGSIVMVFMILIMDRQHFVYRPALRNTRELLQFGGFSTFGDLLTEIIMSAPNLVSGLVLSMSDVGYFGRGQALINFFRQGVETALGQVSRSWFAVTSRDNPDRLKENYLKSTAIICALAWPAYMSLYFLAPRIIPVFLGAGWEPSIVVTQILCFGGLFSIHAFLGMHLFTGMGQVRERVRVNVFGCAALLLGLVVFAGFGLRSVALCVTFSQIVLFGATLHSLNRLIGLRLPEIICSSAPTAAISIIAVFPLILISVTNWSVSGSEIILLAFSVGSVAIFWICGLLLFRHPLMDEILLVLKFGRQSH